MMFVTIYLVIVEWMVNCYVALNSHTNLWEPIIIPSTVRVWVSCKAVFFHLEIIVGWELRCYLSKHCRLRRWQISIRWQILQSWRWIQSWRWHWVGRGRWGRDGRGGEIQDRVSAAGRDLGKLCVVDKIWTPDKNMHAPRNRLLSTGSSQEDFACTKKTWNLPGL